MKKFILSLLLVVVGTTFMFAQNATMRLEMPVTPTMNGEEFFVEVWLDVLEYPGYLENPPTFEPTIKSGQIGIVYDPLVLTPLQTSTPPPPFTWYHNLNGMFTAYLAAPTANLAADGDLRFVISYGTEPGFQTEYFGMPGGMKLWDLKFVYLDENADILIEYGDEDILEPAAGPMAPGGTLGEIRTFLTAWDNAEYAMTYVNIAPSGPTFSTWTGLDIDDNYWSSPDNWDAGGVPVDGWDAVIPNGAPQYPLVYFGGECENLTIADAASVTVDWGAALTVETLANEGDFVIVSIPSGESGSFLDYAGVGGAGDFEFQRDIGNVTAFGSDAGWHLISSPLPTGEFTSDNLLPYYLNYFDPIAQQYMPIVGTEPCVPAATVNNGFMEGWSLKYDGDFAANCGVPDDFVINMMGTTFNDASTVASTGVVAGYNLLGNPFPCALDPDAIAWPVTTPTNTGYMWDGWTGADSWVPFGVGIGESVPPTQGFFVNADGAGTLDVTASRAHDEFQWWWKNTPDHLKLRATVEGSANADITYIRFNEAATAGLDKEWDGMKMFNKVDKTPDIYTHADGNDLCINTQPAVDMVPMSFVCETAGTYTIEAIETGTFAHVVLENVLTGEQTNLLEGSYTFDYSNTSEVHPFIVHFTPLGIGDNFADYVNIWSSANNIYVQVPNVTGDIVVFNMMGQEVVRTDIDPGVNVIPMNDVNTYYVVKVITSEDAVTGKVFIK